jgi:hypothetical protein
VRFPASGDPLQDENLFHGATRVEGCSDQIVHVRKTPDPFQI